MFRSLALLLYPPRCLHCKEELKSNLPLCPVCSLSMNSSMAPITNSWIAGLPHFYSSSYNEVASSIILLAKEENNARARALLASLIVRALPAENFILVPVPSRPAANRVRGYRHATLLAHEVLLLAGGNKSLVIDALDMKGRIRDQSDLSMRERKENVHGKVAVKFSQKFQRNSQPIFIIDDLVTSGASAREAIRALRSENIAPAGVISACAALPY